MDSLLLHQFHHSLGAAFGEVKGREVVNVYQHAAAELNALHNAAAIIDMSFRSRLCVLGADRAPFLHGQVTNNVKDLKTGQGCYAALVSAKGKIQSDLHIYILENEILLDCEPGMAAVVRQRLEKYVIAEDVQVADVAPHYGLFSVQGPESSRVLGFLPLPSQKNSVNKIEDPALGELYVCQHARTGTAGFDLFVPNDSMAAMAAKLKESGAPFCGWQALETARIEAGIPRFGADMDETNLAPEVLGANAISYSKGCYIGQEVIARIRTYGQVAKTLRGLRLPAQLPTLPAHGDKLFIGDKEAGHVTSAAASQKLGGNIALGIVRREANEMGTELELRTDAGSFPAKIVPLPFNV